jgi:hypothetical protein
MAISARIVTGAITPPQQPKPTPPITRSAAENGRAITRSTGQPDRRLARLNKTSFR